jgi:Fe-S-cluster containining protein
MTKEILARYGALMGEIDKRTQQVSQEIAELPCKKKCFECCKQLFPLSFAEAFYLSEGIKDFDRSKRREIQLKAKNVASKIAKNNPAQFELKNVDRKTALNTHAEFAKFLHEIEKDCPALDPKNKTGACSVYDFRNHDCRTMGSAFDASSKEIIGCHRFDSLQKIAPRLMPFNFLYPKKMALDRELISAVTGGVFSPNIVYLTTMAGALLKDFEKEDWLMFFEEKGMLIKDESEAAGSDYFVVIDA